MSAQSIIVYALIYVWLINGSAVIVVNRKRARDWSELDGQTSTAALVKDRRIQSYNPQCPETRYA